MHSSTRRGISPPFVLLFSLAGFATQSALQAAAQAAPAPAHRAPARTQTASNAGTVTGIVADASGAIVPGATVTLSNAISGLSRNVTTDSTGAYTITNLPFNTYRLTVTDAAFAPATQTVEVQSFVPLALNVTLQVASTSTTVEVTTTSGDLVESDPVGHTDVDRDLFSKIPLESLSSSVPEASM